MFRRMTAISLAMVLCAGLPAVAQERAPKAPRNGQPKAEKPAPTLKAGDKAPALSIETWVKGDEVKGFEPGKVYVVEFWATWCPPCVKSIPLLTELQRDFKREGVTVIGVASSERGSDDAAKLDGVKEFVRKKGEEMAYTIAYDSNRSMSNEWMKPAGQGGIPCAFVVDKEGKISYIGNPLNHEKLEDAVKKALQQKADLGAAPALTLTSWQPEKPAKEKRAEAEKNAQPEKKAEKKKDQPKDEGPTLFVGDKAPEIQVGKWVKGDAVTGFEKGTPYVVEFWATWCPPCRESIPHLTELAHKHKDAGLKVVGVSIWENDQDAVEPFVEKMGDKMDYVVATDKLPEYDSSDKNAARRAASSGTMAVNWMNAAGRNGIPTAFIVNREGRIAWIGHPMRMDEPLEKIIKGEWDLEKEAQKARKTATGEKNREKAFQDFQAAAQAGKLDKQSEAAVAMVESEHPQAMAAVQATLSMYLAEEQEYDAGYAFAKKVMEKGGNESAEVLNAIAWTIVDPETEDRIQNKDLDLALRAAKRADELAKSKEPHIIDTLAKVHHLKGDLKKAIELQKKAVDLSGGTQWEEELKQRLEEYEAEATEKKN
jgi:thiol-disulfide isomerase/thioredoxin